MILGKSLFQPNQPDLIHPNKCDYHVITEIQFHFVVLFRLGHLVRFMHRASICASTFEHLQKSSNVLTPHQSIYHVSRSVRRKEQLRKWKGHTRMPLIVEVDQ